MDDSFRSNSALHQQPYHTGSPHTLPPLNGQQQSHFPSSIFQNSNSAPQTPLQQYVPGSTSAGSVPPLRPLQPSNYGMPNANYSAAQSGVNLYPTTTSHGGPAPIAPAPLPGTMQELRPMPQGGLGLPPHSYTPQLLSQQHALTNPEPEPIHVVGQQGRRGVLPTTPGRMAPTSAKQPINPTKNEENKFECPSCNKTYLHLKHLKRHLLRHTGERPYQCHLCKDTFSRSDILKRHFQKCSIRRGNPTGANHLAHSQAHLRKNRLATGVTADQTFIPPLATTMGYSGAFVPPVAAMNGMPMSADNSPYTNGGMQSMSARNSRSNSLIRPGMHESRRSMSSLELGTATRSPFDVNGDFRVPTSMAGTVDHGVASFAPPQQQTSQVQTSFGYNPNASQSELNGDFAVKSESSDASPYARGGTGTLQGVSNGQDNALNWPPPFNAPGQQSFLPATASTEPPSNKPRANNFNTDFHASNDSSDAMFNSLYSGVGSYGEANANFESWLSQNSSLSPLQHKVDSLVTFCFPDEQTDPQNLQFLKNILTTDNVLHFVKLYGNFNSHFPLLHLPSFHIDNTSSGLLMTMICVGAVYSNRIAQDTVRWLMGIVRSAVYRSSPLLASLDDSQPNADNNNNNPQADSEELQTLILLQVLHVWHGTPETRSLAREQLHPKLVAVAKKLNLLQTFGFDSPHCSILHEPGPMPDAQTLQSSWSWEKWIEQEKRVKAYYLILLLDAAFVIFFNAQPNFNIRDIRLPLPADDAVWEARTAEECAKALGLYGSQLQTRNVTGSRQPKQLQMSEAFKMMQSNQDFPLGYTNVYSKFILIHALHIQIWYIHRLFLHPQQANGAVPVQPIMAFPSGSSGASTPMSSHDWMASDGSTGTMSASNSGRATPTEGLATPTNAYPPQLQHDLKALRMSLDKWKKMWDADLALQYPPSNPRTGFCRDGIHFFHLANYLLRAKPNEWQLQPEARMQHAFHLLNQIKRGVGNEQDFKGLERGSVSDMDDGYARTMKTSQDGMEKLTLDMKGLFAPTGTGTNPGGQSNVQP